MFKLIPCRGTSTLFSWFSSLRHSSLFCSTVISRLFSLESFFSPEEARDDACSFKSNKDVCRHTPTQVRINPPITLVLVQEPVTHRNKTNENAAHFRWVFNRKGHNRSRLFVSHLSVRQVSLQQTQSLLQLFQFFLVTVELLRLLPIVPVSLLLQTLNNALLRRWRHRLHVLPSQPPPGHHMSVKMSQQTNLFC